MVGECSGQTSVMIVSGIDSEAFSLEKAFEQID